MFRRNRYWLIAIILLPVIALMYFSNSWGAWTYVRSLWRNHAPSPNAHRNDDLFLAADKARGSVLLLHGLNFEASKLRSLGEVFRSEGFDVMIPRLAGHRGQVEETLVDPLQLWFGQVHEWQVSLKKPIICAGYSMGGLLLVERHLAEKIKCHRFILFAPALAIRTPGFLAEWLERWTPRHFKYPSGIPPEYVHFDHVGLGPSYALMRLLKFLPDRMAIAAEATAAPGLVFLDERDQVISPKGLRKAIEEYFPQWQVQTVTTLELEDENHAYHLIIDEKHLGSEQWKAVTESISEFLKQ